MHSNNMNTQLVEGLVQIIKSLPQEERVLLAEKLKPDWITLRERIIKLGDSINVHSDGKPLNPSVDDIIHQMREERDEQIMSACSPESFKAESVSE